MSLIALVDDPRSSPWPCKLDERRDEILSRVQSPFFSCTNYVAANALTYLTSKYIDAWYWLKTNYETALSFVVYMCAITTDSKSR